MRRKRKFRGIWLPVLGSSGNSGAGGQTDASMLMVVDVPADGSSVVGVRPVLFDTPQESESLSVGADTPMGFFARNGYALRRLVGKIHIDWQTPAYIGGNADAFPKNVQVTAGFFVARAGDINDAGGEQVPVGGTAAFLGDYRPAGPDNIREPWIWRRQWILGNAAIQNSPTAIGAANVLSAFLYPGGSNAFYGSVLDGPHIDAKTRRNVTSDDRLWFALEARTYPYNTLFSAISNDPLPFVRAHLDLRAFGAMRRDRNRGSF